MNAFRYRSRLVFLRSPSPRVGIAKTSGVYVHKSTAFSGNEEGIYGLTLMDIQEGSPKIQLPIKRTDSHVWRVL